MLSEEKLSVVSNKRRWVPIFANLEYANTWEDWYKKLASLKTDN